MRRDASRLLRSLLAAAVVTTAAVARAMSPHEEPASVARGSPAGRAGPAVGVGAGELYAGAGVQASYYFKPTRLPLYVAPFAAVGTQGLERVRPGFAAGASAIYGRNLRFLLDVGYGSLLAVALDLHGTIVDYRTLYGPHVGLGGEVVFDNGVVLRLVPSFAMPWDPRLGAGGRGASVGVSFGIGWKLR